MEEYWKRSRFTNRKYNLFNIVRILNLKQAMAYINNNVYPVDIEIGNDKKTGEKCLVFYFDRDESKDVYDKWCNYELE